MTESQQWDVVVIGAGPAGSVAARQVARQGLSVLLIDKAAFPRDKVCGCCINSAALATLQDIGLAALPAQLAAQPIHDIQLIAAGRRINIPLPGSVSVSRSRFDMALAQSAVQVGARFEPATLAQLDGADASARYLLLHQRGRTRRVAAKLVLVADGLGGRLLDDEPGMSPRIARRSRMGAAVIVDDAAAHYRAGRIYMACGRKGYVGLVRLEDGRLNIAAALEPQFVKTHGGPAAAVAHLLHDADLPTIPPMQKLPWHGTGLLTRKRAAVAGRRLFVLGDAAGYIEPFTGEGIAWALAAANAVTPLATDAARQWDDVLMDQWSRQYRRLVGVRQRRCRLVAAVLRRPRLTAAIARWLARPIIRSIHGDAPERAHQPGEQPA